MKRAISLLLVIVMTTIALAGCDSKSENPAGNANSKQPTDESITIKDSPDKYTWYIKNYVGKNCASIGYTSMSGDRMDHYGAGYIELVMVTPDGAYIDIETDDNLKQYVVTAQSYAPNTELKYVFDTDEDGNEVIYGISEVQDGPDIASAYQALQYSERLLSNIFKYLPIGIELYDMDGVLVDLNDKELEMFHIEKKEDVLGINIFENPIFPKEMKERLKKNEDADFTFRYDFSKVGSYYQNTQKQGTIDLVTKVTTLYDSEHQPINYLLINADKTETTVAYNKIQEFEEFLIKMLSV